MSQPDANGGSDWQRFCQRLAVAGEQLLAAAPDATTRSLGEAYLARLTVYGLERPFLGAQRLQDGLNFMTPRIGGFNPDYRMAQAMLVPGRRYRLSGCLNDVYRLGIGVYSAFPDGRLQLDAYATQRDIDVDAAGRFSVTFAAGPAARNQLSLQASSSMLLLRELVLRPGERRAELKFECLDAEAATAPPVAQSGLVMAQQFIEGSLQQFLQWTQRFAACRNDMMPLPDDLDQAVRGDPGTYYYVGSFDLAEDEQLEIEIPRVSCDYWGLALSSYWLEPLPAHLNHATAQADSDGVCRIRLSRRPMPGHNTIDTAGQQRGVIWHRTIDADRRAVPVVRLIKGNA